MQHEKIHGFEPFFNPSEKRNHPFVAKDQHAIALNGEKQPDANFLLEPPTSGANIIKIDLTAPIASG